MVKIKENAIYAITILDSQLTGTVSASDANLINVKGFIGTPQSSSPGNNSIWVQTGSPTTLKFTNSIGSTITLGAGGGGGSQTLGQTLTLGNTTDGYDVIFTGSSRRIKTNDQVASNTDGDSLTILTGNGNGTGNGGGITVSTGAGGTTGDGGAFTVNAGAAANASASGGSIYLNAGNNSTAGAGGSVNINGGDSLSGSSNAGDIILQGGSLTAVNISDIAGSVYIRGGTVNNTGLGFGGSIYLQTYAGTDGASGDGSKIELDVGEPEGYIQLKIGTNKIFKFGPDGTTPNRAAILIDSNNDVGGEIFCGYRNETTGTAAPLYLLAGKSGGSGNVSGGDIYLTAGEASGTGAGGHVFIEAGNSFSGPDGYVYIKTNNGVIAAAFGPLTNFTSATTGQALVKGSSGQLEFATISGGSGTFSTISPTQITANQNDYAPTGLASANVLRLSTDASRNITGFTALISTDTLIKKIFNIGSFDVVLKHQDVGSSATNRIIVPGAVDITLQPDDCVDIFYDVTTQRWRVC